MMPIPNRDAVALSARTLGALFSYAPNSAHIAPLVAAFQDGSWQQQWPFPVAAPLASAFAASTEESLPEAWQRLFIGPWALPAPPWGSVWLDKESVLFGDSTLALREWMRTNGIALDAERNEPEDHFGTLLLLAACLTAVATLTIGPLSFVGLMAPHIARMMGFRRTMPHIVMSALTGGMMLVFADWCGRMVLFPYQIPAGLLSTFIGAPYFIYLLRKQSR